MLLFFQTYFRIAISWSEVITCLPKALSWISCTWKFLSTFCSTLYIRSVSPTNGVIKISIVNWNVQNLIPKRIIRVSTIFVFIPKFWIRLPKITNDASTGSLLVWLKKIMNILPIFAPRIVPDGSVSFSNLYITRINNIRKNFHKGGPIRRFGIIKIRFPYGGIMKIFGFKNLRN